MNEIKLSFLALSRSVDLEIKSESTIDYLVGEIYLIFAKTIDYQTRKIAIEALQKNTLEFKSKINDFVQKYKDKEPKINQLNTYFKDLEEDEYFFFFSDSEMSTEQSMQLYNYLSALKDGADFKTVQTQHNELFEQLMSIYNISAFDENLKRAIGEVDKEKRICKFCGKNNTETTYRKVAHAVSEALGNKKIIAYEECDECNEKFGKGIENDLITYLDLFRNFFGIKGKNGIPKLKGSNFELANNGTIELKHYSDEEELPKDDYRINVKLDTYDKISMQNIYRSLCKYAISVVENNLVPHFDLTIKWINGEFDSDKLPRVAILKSYELFTYHPKLIVYIRKTDDTKLPYAVGEFRFTFLTFVFILPLTNKDTVDFIKDEDFDFFWEFFKHYSSVKEWEFKDFSDSVKRKFVMNLNFEQKDNEE